VAFSWVDWAIVAVVAVSAALSLRRGFVSEALSLLSWIIAGLVAWLFGGSFSVYLTNYISLPSARIIAGCAILFGLSLVVGMLVNFMICELVRITGLDGTDRFLGVFFGAARGLLLVVVLAGLLNMAPVQQDEWWRKSVLLPHFLLVAEWSKNLVLGWASRWLAAGMIPAH
jgi:membrane protein required for colicin V production